MVKDFVEVLVKQGYGIFTGVYIDCFKDIYKYSENYIMSVSDVASVGFSAGLKITGTKSICCIKDLHDFLKITKPLTDNYGMCICGLTIEPLVDDITIKYISNYNINTVFVREEKDLKKVNRYLKKVNEDTGNVVFILGKELLDD